MDISRLLKVGSAEKYAVILTLGSRFTQVGFVGENIPRFMAPTPYDSMAALKYSEWRNVLFPFLQKLFCEYLQINSKERKLIVIEELLTQRSFRSAMVDLALDDFKVQSIMFYPGFISAAIPLMLCPKIKRKTVLLLDLGFTEARCLAICEGIPLYKTFRTSSLSSCSSLLQHLNRQIKQSTSNSNSNTNSNTNSNSNLDLDLDVLEDILCRCCFISSKAKHNECEGRDGKDMDYQLGKDLLLLIKSNVRSSVFDYLFESYIDEEEKEVDGNKLCGLILSCLLSAPIDFRKELAQNICVFGGLAMIPGIKSKIQTELNMFLSGENENKKMVDDFQFLKNIFMFLDVTPFPPNILSFIGASILGAVDNEIKEVSSKDRRLPDWTSIH